jgi:hypothetical protein
METRAAIARFMCVVCRGPGQCCDALYCATCGTPHHDACLVQWGGAMRASKYRAISCPVCRGPIPMRLATESASQK